MKLSRLLEATSPEASSTQLTTAASTVEQMLISPGAVRIFYHIVYSYFRMLEEHGIARGDYSREIYTIQLRGKDDALAVTRNFYIPYQPENTRIYTAVDTLSEMLEGSISQIPEQFVAYSWAHLHPGFSPLPSSTDANNNYVVLDRLGSNNKLTGYDKLTITAPQVHVSGDNLYLYDSRSKKRVSLKFNAPVGAGFIPPATQANNAATPANGNPALQPVAEWVDETPVTIHWSKSLIFNGRDLDGFFASFSGPQGGHDTRYAYSEISVATIAHDGTITRSTYEIPIRVMEVVNDIVLTDALKQEIETTLREKVVLPSKLGRRRVPPEYILDSLDKDERARLEQEGMSPQELADAIDAQNQGKPLQPPAPIEYLPLTFGDRIGNAIAAIMGQPLAPRRIKHKLTMKPAPIKVKLYAYVNGKRITILPEGTMPATTAPLPPPPTPTLPRDGAGSEVAAPPAPLTPPTTPNTE